MNHGSPSSPATATAVADAISAGLTLREQAGRLRKRQKTLGVALLLVLGLAAFGAYMPMARTLDENRQLLKQAEADLMSNQARAETLPELIATVNALRKQVDQYKPLGRRDDLEGALHFIARVNTETKVDNYEFKTDDQRTHPSCGEQPLRITFDADFVDAISFIGKLESMDRLTRLRSLSLRQRDRQKGGVVSISMSLSLFFANDPDAGPGGAAGRQQQGARTSTAAIQ